MGVTMAIAARQPISSSCAPRQAGWSSESLSVWFVPADMARVYIQRGPSLIEPLTQIFAGQRPIDEFIQAGRKKSAMVEFQQGHLH